MNKLVSVLVITYNHEEYISQAIESILNQKTNFDYEIVIGEDCSTDNTKKNSFKLFKKKYPDKIHSIMSEKNVGIIENAKRTLLACKGKYIAFLEGDDYWHNPHKLQKQVDFFRKSSGLWIST